jgi:hypothetical protein
LQKLRLTKPLGYFKINSVIDVKRVICLLFSVIILAFAASALGEQQPAEQIAAQTTIRLDVSENGFYYRIMEDGTARITRYVGKDSEVYIPSTLGGRTVASIGERAFAMCLHVRQVVFPNTMKMIDNEVFIGCTNLVTVVIPKSVTQIGARAIGYSFTQGGYVKSDKVTIYGKYASAAQVFAKENGFNYVRTDGGTDIPATTTRYYPTAAPSARPTRPAETFAATAATEAPSADVSLIKVSPAKVSGVRLKSAKKRITVTFKAARGAKKYTVKYSYKKNMKSAKTLTVSKRRVIIRKLKSGKRVYVQVRAVSGKSRGRWSKRVSVKIK